MAKEKFTRNIGTRTNISQIGKQCFTKEESESLIARGCGLLHLEDEQRLGTSSFEKYNTPEIREKEGVE